MYAQCVQINDSIIVATMPTARPAHLNAKGMAKIPVPRHDLSKCTKVPDSLKKQIRQICTVELQKCGYLRYGMFENSCFERIEVTVQRPCRFCVALFNFISEKMV